MKTLYLHIGSHKTGSSSIQASLVQTEAVLREHGLHVLRTNAKGRRPATGNMGGWVKAKRADLGKGKGGVVDEGIYRELRRMEGSTIVSGENFAYLFDRAAIESFISSVSGMFEQIKVICYVRRQDRHVVSHYQQASRNANSYARAFYGWGPNRALPRLRPRHRRYLDYNERIGRWADVCGDSNVTVRVFEPARLVERDSVVDFFQLLDPSIEPVRIKVNPSGGFVRTKVAHLFEPLRKPYLTRYLRKFLSDEGKLLPARVEALALYEEYRESNEALNQRFGIYPGQALFSEDFSMYPEEPQDLWDERTANEAIKGLVEGLRNLDLDAQLFRDAGVALETREPALAERLKVLAGELSPKHKVKKKGG